MLAGDKVFMVEYLRVVGGREAVRMRFLEYAVRGIDVSHEFGQTLLADVGWVR